MRRFWIACLVFFICAGGVWANQLQNDVIEVRSASLLWADQQEWKPVELPHNWDTDRREFQGIATYRIPVDLKVVCSKPCAIYIPRWMHNGELYLNDQLLYRGGELRDPISRHFNRPVFAVIPSGLIERQNFNQIEVKVYGLKRFHSGISQFYVGSQEALAPKFHRQHFWNVTGVQLSMAISFAAAFAALVYGLVLAQGKAFILFGVAALSLGARSYALIVRELPLPQPIWGALVFAGYGIFLACVTLAGMYLAGFRNRRIERVIWCLGLSFFLMPFAIFGDPSGVFLPLVTALITPMGVLSGVWLAYIAYRRRANAATAFGVCLAFFGILFTYDALFFLDRRPFDATFTAHYMSIATFVVVLSVMIRENLHAVRQAQTLADSLERDVANYTSQLSERLNMLRAIELKNAQSVTQQLERARIIKEMNDSIGAKLLAAKSAIASGRLNPRQLNEPVQSVLDDLRLMIDSLDPDASDLPALLGNYRYRMQRRLAERGLPLTWHVSPDQEGSSLTIAEAVRLDSSALLALARIVHACVDHAIRYAVYQRLEIFIHQDTSCTELKLRMTWSLSDTSNGPAVPASVLELTSQIGARFAVQNNAEFREISVRLESAS